MDDLATPILNGPKCPIYKPDVTQSQLSELLELQANRTETFKHTCEQTATISSFIISCANDPFISAFVTQTLEIPSVIETASVDADMAYVANIVMQTQNALQEARTDGVRGIRLISRTYATYRIKLLHLNEKETRRILEGTSTPLMKCIDCINTPEDLCGTEYSSQMSQLLLQLSPIADSFDQMNYLHYSLRLGMSLYWLDRTACNMFVTNGYLIGSTTEVTRCDRDANCIHRTHKPANHEAFLSPETDVFPEYHRVGFNRSNYDVSCMYGRVIRVPLLIGGDVHVHDTITTIDTLPWAMSYRFPPLIDYSHSSRDCYRAALSEFRLATSCRKVGNYDVSHVMYDAQDSNADRQRASFTRTMLLVADQSYIVDEEAEKIDAMNDIKVKVEMDTSGDNTAAAPSSSSSAPMKVEMDTSGDDTAATDEIEETIGIDENEYDDVWLYSSFSGLSDKPNVKLIERRDAGRRANDHIKDGTMSNILVMTLRRNPSPDEYNYDDYGAILKERTAESYENDLSDDESGDLPDLDSDGKRFVSDDSDSDVDADEQAGDWELNKPSAPVTMDKKTIDKRMAAYARRLATDNAQSINHNEHEARMHQQEGRHELIAAGDKRKKKQQPDTKDDTSYDTYVTSSAVAVRFAMAAEKSTNFLAMGTGDPQEEADIETLLTIYLDCVDPDYNKSADQRLKLAINLWEWEIKNKQFEPTVLEYCKKQEHPFSGGASDAVLNNEVFPSIERSRHTLITLASELIGKQDESSMLCQYARRMALQYTPPIEAAPPSKKEDRSAKEKEKYPDFRVGLQCAIPDLSLFRKKYTMKHDSISDSASKTSITESFNSLLYVNLPFKKEKTIESKTSTSLILLSRLHTQFEMLLDIQELARAKGRVNVENERTYTSAGINDALSDTLARARNTLTSIHTSYKTAKAIDADPDAGMHPASIIAGMRKANQLSRAAAKLKKASNSKAGVVTMKKEASNWKADAKTTPKKITVEAVPPTATDEILSALMIKQQKRVNKKLKSKIKREDVEMSTNQDDSGENTKKE